MYAFGENVEHLRDNFSPNVKDTTWLKYIGEQKLFLITRDEQIRYRPDEKAALKKYNVGAFFLGGKKKTHWQLVEQLVRNWIRIKEYAEKKHKPFIYRIPPSGAKFVKIPVD